MDSAPAEASLSGAKRSAMFKGVFDALNHLVDSEQKTVAREIRQAYLESDYETARKRLERRANRLEWSTPTSN